MAASSVGLHLLGSILDCEQGEQEVPEVEPREDPGKGQGDGMSQDTWVRSPMGEQAVSQPKEEEDACLGEGFPAKICCNLRCHIPGRQQVISQATCREQQVLVLLIQDDLLWGKRVLPV